MNLSEKQNLEKQIPIRLDVWIKKNNWGNLILAIILVLPSFFLMTFLKGQYPALNFLFLACFMSGLIFFLNPFFNNSLKNKNIKEKKESLHKELEKNWGNISFEEFQDKIINESNHYFILN
ncbi:MAG: hypothetical protein RI945_201 [Candidatus Parcubacteria bacterium]|jgi:hypothetical protein